MRAKILVPILIALPVLLFAFSSQPPVRRAGVPTDDNGQTCAVCHGTGPASSGSVSLDVTSYTPSQPQQIHVKISDTSASHWGFQLTARSVSDTTQEAGTFTPADSWEIVMCDNGSPGPCNGTREFAEQSSSPVTSTPGAGFTFVVNWTPPAQEIGRIAFYVTAVAGNSGAPSSDRTYAFTTEVSAIAACNNTQKPLLNRVTNAATFTPTLASGGLWTIFGSNFETSNLKRSVGKGDLVDNAFPTILGCISVVVDGQPVPITYVQTDQINIQGPATSGTSKVVVVSNPGKPNQISSDTATVTVLPVAPTFLTFNGASIAAQFAGTADIVANASVVSTGKTAKPGDIVTLYGTGFGSTNPAVVPGALATTASPVTSTPVSVTVSSVTLSPSDILYLGLSPGSISGLYQLNIRIPASTPNGDIPVLVSLGGQQTQAGATIPVLTPQ